MEGQEGFTMPRIIGIDEAGYGPNLGPLVMTAVTCQVPDSMIGADLWHSLRDAVRRSSDPDDGRMVVDDSKLVYSSPSGLAGLEAAVWSVLHHGQPEIPRTVQDYLDCVGSPSSLDVRSESWFTGKTKLPVALENWSQQNDGGFNQACRDCSIRIGPIMSVVICPPRFNQLLDHWDSKGAILGHGLKELLGLRSRWEGDDAIEFVIDKHGGRNCYFAMLQEALGEGMVVAYEEGMNRSAYSVWGLRRAMRFTFQPRADAEHFCVALASMASKYLRELLMLEFNSFWRSHLPDLKPTAGYPGDAARFFKKIKPIAKRLGISQEAIWRRK